MYLANSVYLNKNFDRARLSSVRRKGGSGRPAFISCAVQRVGTFRENPRNPCPDRFDLWCAEGREGTLRSCRASLSGPQQHAARGGRMGHILANQYPYAFEAAFSLFPKERFPKWWRESGGPSCILKGGWKAASSRARGKVQEAHYHHRYCKGKDRCTEKAAAKQQIDSIYEVLKSFLPMNFTEMATRLGDDRGSASGRRMLPWFGAGEMWWNRLIPRRSLFPTERSVPPSRAISGWHREAHRTSSSARQKSEMKPQLLARMTSRQDPRYKMIRDRQTETLAKSTTRR